MLPTRCRQYCFLGFLKDRSIKRSMASICKVEYTKPPFKISCVGKLHVIHNMIELLTPNILVIIIMKASLCKCQVLRRMLVNGLC